MLRLRSALLFGLVAIACQSSPPAPKDPLPLDDPQQPGLAFARLPATATLSGLFEVWVRVNDARGLRVETDSTTVVTLSGLGQGRLHGTLSQRVVSGLAIFNNLSYDSWEPLTLVASAANLPTVTARDPLVVRPALRFVTPPPTRVPTGEVLGPFEIELVDGRGQRVPAPQPITGPSGQARALDSGVAVFEEIAFPNAGSISLVWRSPGLADLIHPVFVHDGAQVRGLWLPGARVGRPYFARVAPMTAEFSLLAGMVPAGVTLERTGELHGVPKLSGLALAEIFVREETGPVQLLRARLPIYPANESAREPLDGLAAPGPFGVTTLEEVVEVASRGTSEKMRVFVPEGAPGARPVIVFHHGAAPMDAEHPDLYDRYDHLLSRWAAAGFVVASVNGADLIWSRGRLVNGTLNNLSAIAENLRAAIATLRRQNETPGDSLFGRVDANQVVVAGHSRGGGAALLTAAAEPAVIAGILIKPLDPVTTVGGDKLWNAVLPKKPFLLIAGGNDADLPYPLVDFLYERRAAPMAAVTVLGASHFASADPSVPDEPGAAPTIPRATEWAVVNAYAVAFLKFVTGDLGYAPHLFGAAGLVPGPFSAAVVRQGDRKLDAFVVDDFQDDVPGRNRLGLATQNVGLALSRDEPALLDAVAQLPDRYGFYKLFYAKPEIRDWSGAHRLGFAQDGAVYGSELGGLDVRGTEALVFRARADGAAVAATQIVVRLVDAAGGVALLPVVTNPAGIGPHFGDVLVPLAPAVGLDLGALVRLELVFAGAGNLLIDDLRFE